MKKILITLFATLSAPLLLAEDQTICPLMIESEIDSEEVVQYEGKKIYMCCGSCVTAWEKNPDYYLKLGLAMKLIPQVELTDELKTKLEKVELLEQRYCPIRVEAIVGPDSPSVEYKGKKIYFFKERDIERKWERSTETIFKNALEDGLLPQFEENNAEAAKKLADYEVNGAPKLEGDE